MLEAEVREEVADEMAQVGGRAGGWMLQVDPGWGWLGVVRESCRNSWSCVQHCWQGAAPSLPWTKLSNRCTARCGLAAAS